MKPSLSAELRVGRRVLEEIPGFRILEDFTWSEVAGCWVLHCAIEADVAADGIIPKETLWYIWVQDSYPWGDIAFYPAKKGGISQTFQHQNYNGPRADDVPWRCGRICVDTGLRALGRGAYDIEPFDSEDRFAWHVLRVQEWLSLASRNELTEPGDPFELPYVPARDGYILAFSEGPITFSAWRSQGRRSGGVGLKLLGEQPTILVANDFLGKRDGQHVQPEWGKELGSPVPSGTWIMLNKVPTLEPWQIPTTWGELRQACLAQNIELDGALKSAVVGLRDGNPHILLVGFPIPDKVGGPDLQVHWLALALPSLSRRPLRGFRNTEEGLWRTDKRTLLRDDSRLEWMKTENWHHTEITGRGRVNDAVASKSFLVIGAGAVGSSLAELLVRAGVRRLTVMDHDNFAVGNLVRHTLTMEEIGKSKANTVADRLSAASVHASVTPIKQKFPPKDHDYIQRVLDSDVVIDCTADDSVVEYVSRQKWNKPITFLSVSLGLHARRLFLFAAQGRRFPNEDFRDRLDPWLTAELDGYDVELPRDGMGCWYPKLPARVDDVWMMTAAAFKVIESLVLDPPNVPTLTVLEQQTEDGEFTGLRKVEGSERPR